MTINCSKCHRPLNAVECVACAQPAEILAPLLAVDPTEHALLLAVAEAATAWIDAMSEKLKVRRNGLPSAHDALTAAVDALTAFREANHA